MPLPIFFKVDALVLKQSHHFLRASEIILKDMDQTSWNKNISLQSAYHF